VGEATLLTIISDELTKREKEAEEVGFAAFVYSQVRVARPLSCMGMISINRLSSKYLVDHSNQ
jgi:hypothetical protein